ncbi:AAA family ATPase [Streptomyces sp. ME19-01-6]|uniref:AAA family ATPase n=1 Tax=Streptomyces sp. ME19-01-6 TaxID=3028686 RepID=UPI0029A2B052|nr:AAA family ATPase [Streptomyces sp. ME19-01-6]MDX3224533.1 AAA family ATPase [Streptomyces sp. ME19-01-6]
MRFTVVEEGSEEPTDLRAHALLITDRWNDQGFVTMFHLVVYDEGGVRRDIGEVKIGKFGMTARSSAPVPQSFDHLDDTFFSLGQDDSYYTNLGSLRLEFREQVLSALRDMAFDARIFAHAKDEPVTQQSLLRFVKIAAVEEQFRRIAQGGQRVTAFQVGYKSPAPADGGGDPVVLTFAVVPGSLPPTNIHVLIGRNSVGKSFLLNRLTRCIGDSEASEEQVGRIIEYGRGGRDTFTNLVSVTFSAFDDFPLLNDGDIGIARYAYVGLKSSTSNRTPKIKTPNRLLGDFTESVEACLTGTRAQRWAKALRTLQYAGSGFITDEWLEDFLTTQNADSRRRKARRLFVGLSSGHKVVLLTLTRLVEHVTERTLVVIDEPESHLHPPLLAAFIRALSDLLAERNGLAIVATHSPVVLQEVPASCVWKLNRYGNQLVAERPVIETFGENVGILTHEVFGLEVTDSGYHRYLKRLVRDNLSYEEILGRFDGQLGGEAKGIVMALISVRDTQGGLGPAAEERY